MGRTRRKFSPQFKSKVALAALRGDGTLAELAQKYEVLPVQICKWKKQLLDGIPSIFSQKVIQDQGHQDELTAALYEQIGCQKMELEWVKKIGP